MCKILECSERRAGMVEHTQCIGELLKSIVEVTQSRAALYYVIGIVAALETDGVVYVHVTILSTPCHFKAIAEHLIGNNRVVVRRCSLSLLPQCLCSVSSQLTCRCVCEVTEIASGVKVVGVVRYCEKVNILRIGEIHYILESILERTCAIGILSRMGVNLSEVQRILRLTNCKCPDQFA